MNEIYHNDALDIVDKLGRFDYLITDPPYPVGGQSSLKSGKSVIEVRAMIDSMAMSMIFHVLKKIKKNKPFAIWFFCDWRQVSYFGNILRGMGYDRQSCIVWNKMRGSFSSAYHPSYELILYATDGVKLNKFAGKDIIDIPRPNNKTKTHSFEKPQELVLNLCKVFPKGRVIDPFCGTGGLLVGAKKLGWEVVGVDIEKNFCDIAQDRLNKIPVSLSNNIER